MMTKSCVSLLVLALSTFGCAIDATEEGSVESGISSESEEHVPQIDPLPPASADVADEPGAVEMFDDATPKAPAAEPGSAFDDVPPQAPPAEPGSAFDDIAPQAPADEPGSAHTSAPGNGGTQCVFVDPSTGAVFFGVCDSKS